MNPIEPEILRVLHRMEEEDAEDRKAVGRPREDRMFTLHPDTSRLVHILIQSARCKSLVEIGVAHGYSTIWLAHAARIMGGHVTSLEVNPKSVEIARRNVKEAGLLSLVDFVLGDARETLKGLKGPVDFVLMDCWEWLYVDCLQTIVPLLRPGGLLVADNVEPGDAESDRYIRALEEHPLMETVPVPIGRKIEVSMRKSE
ncbi:MAG: class I SAM-dependent methyltransferase [Planctomycetes bacterium]|nr:class I SAM-dependent methyltransferase [Planctomycetota bacterium]